MAYLLKVMSRVYRLPYTYTTRAYGNGRPTLAFSKEVLLAKAEGRAIVALESTIITHGMPYPQNLETAIQVEEIVRKQGATPATIAILKGQLTVGLSEQQLKYLAQAKGVVKASRRDLAPVVAAGLDGGTTVAGTIIACELADIPVFVTGGIGGVHREGQHTLDVSADLTELGRNKTLVVCSGIKSILDIERTLEYLETQGVCVCTFGESDEFPAFYTVRSGHRAPHHVSSAHHAAKVLYAARTLRIASGIVMGVPVPLEYAMDEKIIDGAIMIALEEAKKKGIKGKQVTPFILAAVAKATGGASLAANIALIKNNAKVGAAIAVEYKKLKDVDRLENSNIGASKSTGYCAPDSTRQFHTSCVTFDTGHGNDSAMFGRDGDVLVIGGANVDRTYNVTEEQVLLDGSTHACAVNQCGGGVARNMAEALWRLRGGRARLLTVVGDDADGRYLADIAPGLLLDGCKIPEERTPTYAAVLDARGECLLGLGDMSLHNHISINLVDKHMDVFEKAPLIVLDGNAPQQTIEHVLQLCHRLKKPVFFEPTDRRKAVKPLNSKHRLAYASPNLSELRSMASFLQPDLDVTSAATKLDEILQLSEIVTQVAECLIITLGGSGVMIIRKENNIRIRFYPVQALDSVVSVSGAGDCFASGYIHGLLSGLKESQCVAIGFESAKCALLSKTTVPVTFSISGILEAKCETIL